MKMNTVGFLCVIFSVSMIESSYFYGGTVSWKPLNKINSNSDVPMIFTQSYQRGETEGFCEQLYSSDQSLKMFISEETLQCVTLPSNSCGNYRSISVSGYCTDYSKLDDSSVIQISDIENIRMHSTFCIAYRGASWPVIQSSICGSNCSMNTAKNSIGTCVHLAKRSDGSFNTPPITKMISPIQVPIDDIMDIVIPVMDLNNDTIRCRWARNTSTFDECGDICGVLPNSELNTNKCTLIFNSTGTKLGDFYAVALMIEDFSIESSSIPLSSVSLQFLIEIIDRPNCFSKPTISSIVLQNTVVEVGIPYQFTLTIVPRCSGMTILDFFRISPLNMFKSNTVFDAATNKSFITEIWTPTEDQIGSQIYCAVATDNAHVQSDLYYLTFIVVAGEDEIRKERNVQKLFFGHGSGSSGNVIGAGGVSVATIAVLGSHQASSITSQTVSEVSTNSDFTSEISTDTSSDTTSTSTTSSTSTLSISTTSTSTTKILTTSTSTTSSTSTSSTSTSSSSSTSTSSTSSSSTTSTVTNTTVAIATTYGSSANVVTVTVPTRDNAGLIGLGLGLGLPLLLSLATLALYSSFRQQCMSLSRSLSSRLFRSGQTTNDPINSATMLTECKDDSTSFAGNAGDDYRHQYIRETSFNDDQMNNLYQSPTNDSNHPLPPDQSFASVSISDFDLNNSNVTTTSLFSPSTNTLPNNHVQIINEKALTSPTANSKTSLLVRAYSQQEKNKTTDS